VYIEFKISLDKKTTIKFIVFARLGAISDYEPGQIRKKAALSSP